MQYSDSNKYRADSRSSFKRICMNSTLLNNTLYLILTLQTSLHLKENMHSHSQGTLIHSEY